MKDAAFYRETIPTTGKGIILDGRPAQLDLVPRSAACAADLRLFEQWLDYLRAS